MSRAFWFTIGVHSSYQKRRDIVQGFFRTLSCKPRATTQVRFSLCSCYIMYDNSRVENIISQSKVYVKKLWSTFFNKMHIACIQFIVSYYENQNAYFNVHFTISKNWMRQWLDIDIPANGKRKAVLIHIKFIVDIHICYGTQAVRVLQKF